MAYRNAFDLPRDALLTHIERLRAHIFQPTARHGDDEARHNIPVSVMGNYQETVRKRGDLREINEDDERRARMPLFGALVHRSRHTAHTAAPRH